MLGPLLTKADSFGRWLAILAYPVGHEAWTR